MPKENTTVPENAADFAAVLSGISEPLLLWFHRTKRCLPWRDDPRPYYVWVSEIMLQQTRVTAVLPYFARFIAALPNVSALAAVSDDALLKLWEGLGYYSRARNLKKAAQIIVREHGGEVPRDFATLLTLPGIGRYTAGAISSIAGGERRPAVDGNVLRVVTRLAASSLDIMKESTRRLVEEALLPLLPSDPGAFNQAMMELGALVCLPRGAARCDACPLTTFCRAHAAGNTAAFPVKAPKKARRIEPRTVLWIERSGRVAITQRPGKGLLAGLWELPNFLGTLTRADVKNLAREAGWRIDSLKALPPARHIFSHIEWALTGWHLTLADGRVAERPALYSGAPSGTYKAKLPAKGDIKLQVQYADPRLPPFLWATPDELLTRYSVPAAFHYYFPINYACPEKPRR